MRLKRSKASKEVCSVSELIDKIDDNEIVSTKSCGRCCCGIIFSLFRNWLH